MKTFAALLLGATALVGTSALAQTTLTIATVNNNDMIVMQKLSKDFEEKNPDIKLNWVTLEENVLRQKITTDIATQGGQYDIMTIGMFETPLFGEKGWLSEFKDVPADYKLDDVLKSVRDGLSFDGKLYALPFYAESQMTFYRKDLFDKAGITMPDQPTWEQIGQFAEKITDKDKEIYGVCLRGKPGWGENMGQIGPVVNSYGGRWFDMDWKPQLTTEPWKEGVTTYVDLLKKYGPPGASSNGFNETLSLFASGKCGMWVDATVAAGFLTDKKQSQVADKMGYAHPPIGKFDKGNHYLWSWALAVPVSSNEPEAAKKFIYWATSQDYIKLVAKENGWAAVPPGTRTSTYDTPEYISAAPFAKLTLETIQTANPTDATQEKVPYRGISYVGIPEFQSFGTAVGQKMSAVIAGQSTVDEALNESQKLVERTMKQAGYPKK
ncbi:ABC-type sugar transport system, periplasmic component [Rhizobium leguminosarum bv. trifolii WSM597]|uniref:ABC-type sugar transport system, periplasmic component n=1 Tax=Rhizobium leguminosarum bv. trifolii WSM597 TaxID=754764 RepID=J0H9P5_RHILT|nr:sugar ABC transporter substrate-binding protein [Rhizobium leguminosarum]EJB07130.1 ABC-type sugar transport system, periplasmic component [Rhizobium leguminosarum bv. trifolii WSM597]